MTKGTPKKWVPCTVGSHEVKVRITRWESKVPEAWLVSTAKCPLKVQSSRVWPPFRSLLHIRRRAQPSFMQRLSMPEPFQAYFPWGSPFLWGCPFVVLSCLRPRVTSRMGWWASSVLAGLQMESGNVRAKSGGTRTWVSLSLCMVKPWQLNGEYLDLRQSSDAGEKSHFRHQQIYGHKNVQLLRLQRDICTGLISGNAGVKVAHSPKWLVWRLLDLFEFMADSPSKNRRNQESPGREMRGLPFTRWQVRPLQDESRLESSPRVSRLPSVSPGGDSAVPVVRPPPSTCLLASPKVQRCQKALQRFSLRRSPKQIIHSSFTSNM